MTVSPLDPDPPPVRRIALGVLLTSIAASVLVAMIGGLFLALLWSFVELTGGEASMGSPQAFANQSVTQALMLCVLNIFIFFITVPVTALTLSLSLGLMPRRRIIARMPYLRWSILWGALLTGTTTGLFGNGLQTGAGLGAFATGALVGALAGFVCGHLFFAIVRPDRQLNPIDTSVF